MLFEASFLLHKWGESMRIFFVFSPNNTSWLSLHVGIHKCTSFFLTAMCYYRVQVQYNLFNQFTIDGYLRCLPFFTTGNNDMIHIQAHKLRCSCVTTHTAQICGNNTTGILIFNFDTFCQNISKTTVPIYIATNNKCIFVFPRTLANTGQDPSF